MLEKQQERFKELYKRWSEEEWSSEDQLKLIRLARALTKLEPLSPIAWDALATSIMGVLFPPERELTGDENEALKANPLFWEMIEAFGQEMSLDSDESAASWNRAVCFEQAGLFQQAYEDYLRTAEIEQRGSPEKREHFVHVELFKAGEAIFKYGDYNKAVDTLKAAIQAAAEENEEGESAITGEIWYYLARSLEELGKVSEALDAYKKSATLDPGAYEKAFLDAKQRLAGIDE